MDWEGDELQKRLDPQASVRRTAKSHRHVHLRPWATCLRRRNGETWNCGSRCAHNLAQTRDQPEVQQLGINLDDERLGCWDVGP